MRNKNMRDSLFGIGILLLIYSFFSDKSISNNTLVLFGFLLLLAFFDELQEFNFLGLQGRKIEKKLEELKENADLSVPATSPSEVEDDLTKLKNKTVQLMTVDRGNFLALVFEIERLLRSVGNVYKPNEINDATPLVKVTKILKDIGYLTESGAAQVKALVDVRNLIVHGRVGIWEDPKLEEWTALAYNLYKEIYSEVNSRNQQASN